MIRSLLWDRKEVTALFALKLIFLILGTAFAAFGGLILFMKKYYLINGFTAAQKSGRKDERYAVKVGLAEFVIGIILLGTGIILIVFV